MARIEHEKADARRRAQVLINLELDRYARRLKQAAEDFIDLEWDRARAVGAPFDHVTASDRAIEHAQSMYVSKELVDAEAEAALGE